jgi:hypothetical protein
MVLTPHDPPNRNRYRKYTFKALARCGGARPRSAGFQEAGRLYSAYAFFLFRVGSLTSLAGLFPMGIRELYIVDYY